MFEVWGCFVLRVIHLLRQLADSVDDACWGFVWVWVFVCACTLAFFRSFPNERPTFFLNEKSRQKNHRLIMLLWKNYGEKSRARFNSPPIRPEAYRWLRQNRYECLRYLFPPCFSHKTMKRRKMKKFNSFQSLSSLRSVQVSCLRLFQVRVGVCGCLLTGIYFVRPRGERPTFFLRWKK